MLPNGSRLDQVAALHRCQHREKDRVILSLPHDMVLEFFRIDSIARCGSDVHKGPTFLEPYGTDD